MWDSSLRFRIPMSMELLLIWWHTIHTVDKLESNSAELQIMVAGGWNGIEDCRKDSAESRIAVRLLGKPHWDRSNVMLVYVHVYILYIIDHKS